MLIEHLSSLVEAFYGRLLCPEPDVMILNLINPLITIFAHNDDKLRYVGTL